jgi:hypothetical protein
MNIRIAACLAVAVFLSGCSDQDWNHALSFVGVNGGRANAAPATSAQAAPSTPRPATVPARTAAEAAPKPNEFCESVAAQDSQGNDFDSATQRRVFVQSYQQCVAIFGDATK